MLTATIEQKVFSLHQTSSISKCCTHTTILNHCLITLSKTWLNVFNWKSQLQDRLSVPATVTNNTKITTVYNNKHLDGGLRSHCFFFSPKKQTHTKKILKLFLLFKKKKKKMTICLKALRYQPSHGIFILRSLTQSITNMNLETKRNNLIIGKIGFSITKIDP